VRTSKYDELLVESADYVTAPLDPGQQATATARLA